MVFTALGRIVAILASLFGCLRIGMGFGGAISENSVAFAARYLGTANTGEAITQGFYLLVFGILVGVLTDISRLLSTPE